jgi:integrase
MGRKRTKDRHLPTRVYLRAGSYYFVDQLGKWHRLGRDFGSAMTAYGRILEDSPLRTMGDLFDRYQREIMPTKAPKTQRDNAHQLKRLRSVFAHMRPQELQTVHVYQYRDRRGLQSKTGANRELELLSHVCSKARQWGAMTHHPCMRVEKFRTPPRRRYVTDAEFDLVYALAPPMIQIAMDLALHTGLRRGDLLALTRDHLTEDGIVVNTAKTGKAMVIGWSPDLTAIVERAKAFEPQVRRHLICTKKGKAYSGDGFNSVWSRVMDAALKAGLAVRFTFHDLRGKSASDDTLEASSKRLGHADPRITQRVYRRKPETVSPLIRTIVGDDNA